MKIVWSADAKQDYEDNISYLIRMWSEQVAIKFIEQVEDMLFSLKSYPEMYPQSSYKSVRKAVITRHTTLLYKIDEDAIYLVRFWNNYQDPDKLKL